MLAQGKAQELGLSGNIDWLPIVIEFRDLERNLDSRIIDYIHQYAEKNLQLKDLPKDFFEHWLNQHQALILFDGIDEVANEGKRYKVVEQLQLFLNQYPGNIAIATSRPSGYKRDFFSSAEFPHYQLQPFDNENIKEFIDNWYDSRVFDPEEANRRKDSLRKALQDQSRIKILAKNPLLLTIITLIHRYQAYLPKERHKLYDKAVETLLNTWDANRDISGHKELKYLDLSDLRRLLESLAREIHSRNLSTGTEAGTQIAKDELFDWLSNYIKINKQKQLHEAREEATKLLDFIRKRTGLLNEQSSESYAFVHKTFQEYLCAQDINYEADDEDDFKIILDCIRKHLHDPHWREVLLLLIAQQKPQKALKAIELIYRKNSQYEQWLHRDLFFAGSCLADSPKGMGVKDKQGLVREILTELVNLEIKDRERVRNKVYAQVVSVITSLAETDCETKVLNLLKDEKDKIEQFRFLGYQSELGEKEEAISILLSLLQDTDSIVCYSAAEALVQLGEGRTDVIDALLPLLNDDDGRVRYSAAEALGKLGEGRTDVIDALLLLFKDDNIHVRSRAASALAKISNDNSDFNNSIENWLKEHSDTKYVGDGIDVLWNVVVGSIPV